MADTPSAVEQRAQARAVKAYLDSLASTQGARSSDPARLKDRLKAVSEKIDAESNSLRKAELIQTRLDLEAALADAENSPDNSSLEEGFVAHAADLSQRKGISYTAWRSMGVPAAILRKAGIPITRSRSSNT